jgi:hypothetical protein
MATSTGTILRTAAHILNHTGLHTGFHFAGGGELDLTAAIFRAVTGKTPPSFYNDDDLALLQIRMCEPAMDAIRLLSQVLPTDPPTDPATGLDDHIEHVSSWPVRPRFADEPAPSTSEVIGNLLRAACAADAATVPHQRAA